MIYPKNFESKIGFSEIRTLLRGRCLSAMGADEVAKMAFSSDVAEVNRMLATVKEFRSIMDGDTDFPVQNITDMRAALLRLQIKGTYIASSSSRGTRRHIQPLASQVKRASLRLHINIHCWPEWLIKSRFSLAL